MNFFHTSGINIACLCLLPPHMAALGHMGSFMECKYNPSTQRKPAGYHCKGKGKGNSKGKEQWSWVNWETWEPTYHFTQGIHPDNLFCRRDTAATCFCIIYRKSPTASSTIRVLDAMHAYVLLLALLLALEKSKERMLSWKWGDTVTTCVDWEDWDPGHHFTQGIHACMPTPCNSLVSHCWPVF